MRTALTCLNQVTGCLFLLVGLVVAPTVANAGPVTFTFGGAVTQDPLLDPTDPFGGTIAFGTPFSGSFVFDSTTLDGDGSPNGGSYTSGGGSLTLTIGGRVFLAADLLNIGVANNFSGSDFYTVFAQSTGGLDVLDARAPEHRPSHDAAEKTASRVTHPYAARVRHSNGTRRTE